MNKVKAVKIKLQLHQPEKKEMKKKIVALLTVSILAIISAQVAYAAVPSSVINGRLETRYVMDGVPADNVVLVNGDWRILDYDGNYKIILRYRELNVLEGTPGTYDQYAMQMKTSNMIIDPLLPEGTVVFTGTLKVRITDPDGVTSNRVYDDVRVEVGSQMYWHQFNLKIEYMGSTLEIPGYMPPSP